MKSSHLNPNHNVSLTPLSTFLLFLHLTELRAWKHHVFCCNLFALTSVRRFIQVKKYAPYPKGCKIREKTQINESRNLMNAAPCMQGLTGWFDEYENHKLWPLQSPQQRQALSTAIIKTLNQGLSIRRKQISGRSGKSRSIESVLKSFPAEQHKKKEKKVFHLSVYRCFKVATTNPKAKAINF